MKQEVKDIVFELATKTTPASFLAWVASVNWTTFLAGVLVLLQIAYLLRKWWREETEWGIRLKRWAVRHGITKPADLDEA
jgi:hypothetical protein